MCVIDCNDSNHSIVFIRLGSVAYKKKSTVAMLSCVYEYTADNKTVQTRYPMDYHISVTEYVGKLKYVAKCKDSKVKQDFRT